MGKLFPTSHALLNIRNTHKEICRFINVENPSTESYSFLRKSETLLIWSLQMSSFTPQTSLNISGLLANRNIVLLEQTLARCAPSRESRNFARGNKNLVTAVNVGCLHWSIRSHFMSQKNLWEGNLDIFKVEKQ